MITTAVKCDHPDCREIVEVLADHDMFGGLEGIELPEGWTKRPRPNFEEYWDQDLHFCSSH